MQANPNPNPDPDPDPNPNPNPNPNQACVRGMQQQCSVKEAQLEKPPNSMPRMNSSLAHLVRVRVTVRVRVRVRVREGSG